MQLWNRTLIGFYIHKYCKVLLRRWCNYPEALWGNDGFRIFIRWSAMKTNFQAQAYLNCTLKPHCECFPGTFPKNHPANIGVRNNVSSICYSVVTLKQNWINVISSPCVCWVFIWTPIPTCLWKLSTLFKRDCLAIYLKIRKLLMKVDT